jgi:nucleoside-diphosphate-sugar epimerase
MSGQRLFVFGLGYAARALATALKAEGWSVAGTARTAEGCAALDEAGFEAHRFADDHPLDNADAALAEATHVLLSIPPGPRGDPVLARYGELLTRLRPLEWVGYLSSTAVYGDTGGEWVSEASWLKPGSDRARRRVEAERGWLDLRRQQFLPVHVFRLPGIYGPGRSAIDDLRAGTAKRIDKPGQVFSRIHVDDIAGTLRASMARRNPGGIYNVADDLPAPAHEVVAHAAGLLGIAPPPLVPVAGAGLSEMGASFYAECRRVRNDRIKTKLGVVLKHPDYTSGLAAQLAAERG